MTNEQIKEIETSLEGMEFALQEMRGAIINFEQHKKDIYDILHGVTGNDIFSLDEQSEVESRVENIQTSTNPLR